MRCFTGDVPSVLVSAIIEVCADTLQISLFRFRVASFEFVHILAIMIDLQIRVAESFSDESLVLFGSLCLDEKHVVDGTTFREELIFEPLKHAVISRDLVHAKLMGDRSCGFQRAQQGRALDYDFLVPALG